MRSAMKYGVPSLAFFGYYFAFTMFFAFMPLRMNELHISQRMIGVLTSVHPLMLLGMSVPFGMFSDRFSPRNAAAVGLLIMSASVYALHWCSGFWGFFGALSGAGAGVALFTINTYSLYFKSLGAARHGAKLALINSLSHVGYGCGPMAGSIILGAGGTMNTLFLAAAGIFLPFAVLMFAAPDVKLEKFPPKYYLEDLRDKRKWFMFATLFIFCLHFGAENVVYSLFLKYNCGVPESHIGYVFMFVGLSLVPATIVTGVLADRVRRSDRLLAVGLILSGVFNVGMFFADGLWSALLLRVGHAIGDGIFIVYLDVAVSRMFPSKRIGAPVGLRDMIKTGGTLAGSLLAGFLPGYAMPFVVTGFLAMALTPFVYRYFRSE